MTRVLIPAAVALLLGAVVTELFFRVYPGQYFALLLSIVTAILAGSLISVRAITGARRAAPAGSERAPRSARPRAGEPAGAEGTRAFAQANASTAPAGPRESGHVKWFNRTKGFGFIVRDNGGEVFVHHRNIEGAGRQSLRDGQRVTFVVAEGEKGLQAEQVSAAEADAEA